MFADWIWTSWDEAGLIVLSAFLMVVIVIGIIRLVGLRSLSKMSSFDFAVTVAIGSIMASTVVSSTPVANGALAALAPLGVQALIAVLRRFGRVSDAIDNDPMLLMRNGEFIDDALRACRVTRSDVIAKLREANVLQLSEVRAVVLETTGDISVLHGDVEPDDILFDDVQNPPR